MDEFLNLVSCKCLVTVSFTLASVKLFLTLYIEYLPPIILIKFENFRTGACSEQLPN